MALDLPSGLFEQSDVRETASQEPLAPGAFAVIYNSGNQLFSNESGENEILFDTDEIDDDDLHNTGVDTERFTVTKAGLYLLTANFTGSGSSSSNCTFKIYEGATVIAERETVASARQSVTITALRHLTVGSFFKTTIQAFVNDVTLDGGRENTNFSIIKLS